MEGIEEKASKSGIKVKLQILKSISVVKDITGFVKSKKIDLIVMSSHGRTGLNKVILGNVANGVVQQTECPVLLLR